MRSLGRATLWLAALTAASPASAPAKRADSERASAIKDAFQFSWSNYEKYAFPNDTLHPLTQSYENDRNGWGATAVDALSTATIMRDVDTVNKILDHIAKTNFTTTAVENDTISLFETTIRYIGGMLSGHDLLTGPFKDLGIDEDRVKTLLEQAKNLADTLSIAFDTPSGVPDNNLVFNPKPARGGSDTNSIAGFGTLVLEWTRLSDLTGDTKYADVAQKAEKYLLDPQPAGPWPGIVGTNVKLSDGQFSDESGGWGGGDDSFYEYLIKMYAYDPDTFAEYKDRWVLAAESTIEHLALHPSTRKDLTFLVDFDGTTVKPESSHLASFSGGNFILGGLLLNNKTYLDLGLQLANSYYETYRATPSGIGPEGFSFLSGNGSSSAVPSSYASFYNASGFWPTSSAYILRPETAESLYYAYRATGDAKWQDKAWEVWKAIDASCRVADGFAELQDVMQPAASASHIDKMESFWLAEALKYLYLIFAEDGDWQVQGDGAEKFVFNTEAHPLKVRG